MLKISESTTCVKQPPRGKHKKSLLMAVGCLAEVNISTQSLGTFCMAATGWRFDCTYKLKVPINEGAVEVVRGRDLFLGGGV